LKMNKIKNERAQDKQFHDELMRTDVSRTAAKTEELKLGEVETKFAELIWKNEPISSGELVKLCANEPLCWKKSTTYTVLRKLCERGIFENDNGIVRSLMSKDEYFSRQSEIFVNENFGGSLPGFLAAFTSRKQLSEQEASELIRLITTKYSGKDGK